MSTVASIVLAAVCLVILCLVVYLAKAFDEIAALRDKVEDQAETIDGIQDAIAASPSVTYPYIYTNATARHEP